MNLKDLSLRGRLFASYLFLLVISFVVLVVATLVLFSSTPAPVEPTYEQLTVMLPELSEIEFAPPGDITNQMDTFASERGARVLLVVQLDNAARVLHDTAAIHSRGEALPIEIDHRFSARSVERYFPKSAQVFFGRINEPNGTEWLFSGLRRDPEARLPINIDRNARQLAILVADTRPTTSLRSVLLNFGRSILPPLAQSFAVGGVIAFLLALIISRNIARPLQALADGAVAVASGNYNQRVPERGPREVRSVAHAFNHMTGEVRATQQSQRDFMANVSHDLKTPLTSIQGYSQAIMDGVAPDPAEVAGIIHDEAARLNRMVVELTDLARLQAGRLSMNMTSLQMNEIVTAISQRLAVVAEQDNIDLHLQTEPLPAVVGDGDRLAQVMTNLISNAIKYTDSDGDVWVRTRRQRGGIQIEVEDSGIGIAPDELKRIFERFYQVDKARGPSRGTGLGLAITKEIIDAHGGDIHVHSAGKDQGTTFTIWLPAAGMETLVNQRRL